MAQLKGLLEKKENQPRMHADKRGFFIDTSSLIGFIGEICVNPRLKIAFPTFY